ncbi:methyltransferase domain-containing protein [Sorangium sp. So ce1128]
MPARFLQADILDSRLDDRFDVVFDRGCFHCLPPERRADDVRTLKRLVAPGGLFFLKCFSVLEPRGQGRARDEWATWPSRCHGSGAVAGVDPVWTGVLPFHATALPPATMPSASLSSLTKASTSGGDPSLPTLVLRPSCVRPGERHAAAAASPDGGGAPRSPGSILGGGGIYGTTSSDRDRNRFWRSGLRLPPRAGRLCGDRAGARPPLRPEGP